MTIATLTTKTESVTATLNEKTVTVSREMASGKQFTFEFPLDTKKAFPVMGKLLTESGSGMNPLVAKAFIQVTREEGTEELSGNQLKKAFEPVQLEKMKASQALFAESQGENMSLASSQKLKSGNIKTTFQLKSKAELNAMALKYKRIEAENSARDAKEIARLKAELEKATAKKSK